MPPVEQKFSTRNVDYLQRTGEFTPGASTFPHAPQETIFDFVKVLGVGRLDKSSASEIRQTAVTDWQLTQLISENLLIGLYAVGSRIAFLIDGEPGHVGLYLGISRSAKGAAGTVDGTQTLTTILN